MEKFKNISGHTLAITQKDRLEKDNWVNSEIMI
jgi:hypothetical protein